VHNPFGLTHDSPYALHGDPSVILEKRRVTEVMLTLRWSGTIEPSDPTAPRPPPPAGSAHR